MPERQLDDLAGDKVMAQDRYRSWHIRAEIERTLRIVTTLPQIEWCRSVVAPVGIRVGSQKAVAVM